MTIFKLKYLIDDRVNYLQMILTRIFARHTKLQSERITFNIVNRCRSSQSCDDRQEKYAVVSLYHLNRIENVDKVSRDVMSWLQYVGATGRFQINKQGVNCQLCFKTLDNLEPFKQLLSEQLDVNEGDLRAKVHLADFNVFKKLRVKQKLLEYLDDDADISDRGEHLDSEVWNEILDTDDEALVLDIRNGWEWDVGRFKQAERPGYQRFKQFTQMVEEVVDTVKGDRERKVMMYCTGGIRCELFSSLLKKEEVKNVYQLQDGVLGYGSGSVEDSRHWEGNLFVFDDRLVVPIDGVVGGDKDKPVSVCRFCGAVTHMVYNCNSLQCNAVFVACMQCAAERQGFCSEQCCSVTSPDHQFVARNTRQWRGKLIGRGHHYRELMTNMARNN